MAFERDPRNPRRFAGEPQSHRSRSEAIGPRESKPTQLPPGRSTLTEALAPAPVDVARVFGTQLENARNQLPTLEAANHAGDHHASGLAAAGIRSALRLAEKLVAAAHAESADRAAALEHRLASAREAVRSALELAFTPSPAAQREAVTGAGRAQWDREVAAWRAARGLGAVSDHDEQPTGPLAISWIGGTTAAQPGQARPRGAAPARSSAGIAPGAAVTATPTEPWSHILGEASTPVNKLAHVQAPRGRTLLQHPRPDSAPATAAPLPFDTRVVVLRRTMQPTAAERWCYVTAPDHGATGFCEERYLAIDPPEPRARLHRVEGGETLGKISRDVYGEHITGGNDERLYVQALYEANKDRVGVKLSPVTLSWSDTWHRREAEERTLAVYLGVRVIKGTSLWIPSNELVQRLKASGAITTGSSELSKAWRAAAEVVDDTVEAVQYAAGFILGLLEGAWSAIADLFKGAADLLEAVAKALYHLVTGNPGRIKAMLLQWAHKMKSAWEQRGAIADEFLKKWNAPSGWDRGRFHGEVLGWVMMTVLIIIVTAGESAAASAGGLAARFPQAVKLLKTVDAVGDITTYLGGALKAISSAGQLPEAASATVKSKLGKADHVTGDGARPTSSARSAQHTPDVVTVRGYAQGPRLQWMRNADGAVRTIDEAVEIARKNGVHIPDDILLRKVTDRHLPDNTYAKYFGQDVRDPSKLVRWDDFYNKDLDQLLVHIKQSILQSDEAIVAVLGHEMYELNHLRRLFEESGGAMTYRRLHYLISAGIKGNLHDQAWDVADKLVAEMRKAREGAR